MKGWTVSDSTGKVRGTRLTPQEAADLAGTISTDNGVEVIRHRDGEPVIPSSERMRRMANNRSESHDGQ